MAEHKPQGILKHPSEFPKFEDGPRMRFDEEGIAEIERTKDYGFMKIDEPKTPYHAPEEETNGITDVPDLELAEQESDGEDKNTEDWSDGDDESGEDAAFKKKRAAHYNEFQNVQRARELLEQDEDE